MKSTCLNILLLVCSIRFAAAQDAPKKKRGYSQLPQVEAKVVYTDVLAAPNLDQNALFDLTKQWLTRNVTGAADTTHTYDRTAGILTAHGRLEQPLMGAFKDPNTYDYSFTVQVKDGKYKYQVDRIRWTYATNDLAGKVAVGPFTRPIEHLGTLQQPHFVQERAAYLDEAIRQLLTSLDTSIIKRNKEKISW